MTEDLKRGTRLGRYDLLLRIGRGGMATVWVARERAERAEDQRLVAIKAILPELNEDPEFVKMFMDEGRLVRSIHHASVVDVYEVAEFDGTMCMVMEWVEGDSLHTLIAEAGKRRPVPPEMAVKMMADAAAGLHAAHEAKDDHGELLGVVHRDVSPHNILIGTDGAVKLVDFGVAKAMGRISEATSAGQLKGKFGYMSPEQAMAKPVDRRSDVFSLGIVLFELTTGRRLFRGEHDAETLHLVVSGQIPKPTSIDPQYPIKLEAIVMRALERDLSRRYQTADELRRDLEGYLKEERLFVAPAGLANLLKKVLGEKIEQRRKAVRATLKQLEAPGSGDLPSSELTPLAEGPVTATGQSGPSGVTGSGTSEPSQASHATAPHSLSGPTERRGGVAGYIFGAAALAVALVAVGVLAMRGRGTTTTTIITAPAVTSTAAATTVSTAAATAAVSSDVPVVGLDELGKAPRVVNAPPGAAPAAAAADKVADKPKDKPKPAPAPVAGPNGLKRANPYGD